MTLAAADIDAIASRVVEMLRAPSPVLLSAEELGVALKVSKKTVEKLTARGCPVVMVERLPRYDLQEVRVWLRARATPASAEPPETDDPPARRLGRGAR